MATFWVTKYALTTGVERVEAEDPINTQYVTMLVVESGRSYRMFHGDGREWHRTEKRAINQAYALKEAKIASLEKQIAKLRKKEFRS